jgi:hypothetical protein
MINRDGNSCNKDLVGYEEEEVRLFYESELLFPCQRVIPALTASYSFLYIHIALSESLT